MNSLKDSLSGNSLSELVFSQVHIGDVFRMHLGAEEGVRGKHADDDGRNKYFVVLGFDNVGNAVGFVLIDSEINRFLPQKRKDMHYPLKASTYSFLGGKNRFVDCSDLKEISRSRFVELFSVDSLKGSLTVEDVSLIKAAVVSYEDAQPKQLKRFGLI